MFVAKRVLCFSIIHLIVMLLIASLVSASVWLMFTKNTFNRYYPTYDMYGGKIDYDTEVNPLYYGGYSVKWNQLITTLLAV